MAFLARSQVVILVGVTRLLAQTVPPDSPATGYVDSKRCAVCHREIAENYARTGMGRSFYIPEAANTVVQLMEQRKPRDTEFYLVLANGWKIMGNAMDSAATYSEAALQDALRTDPWDDAAWDGDMAGAESHLSKAAKSGEAIIVRPAEQALKELGIR